MQEFNVLLLIGAFLIGAHAQTTYRARVLDFTPKDDGDAILTPNYNLAKIEDNVEGAADIIVFPEYGLTTAGVLDKPNYKDYAIVVPEGGETDFCLERGDTHEIINKLSCIAQQKSKYLVVNLLEKDKKDSDAIYNTNVVFNRKGALIAKYRKINLFGIEQQKLKAGKELVTFKTDFNVHFGLFTCYDILFRKPAIDILEKDVTDIIYTTAWFSEIPFLTALQVQDGYAKKTGVNLLVSGYNAPSVGSGGSGIYLANGDKFTTISSIEGLTPIEQDVPIITSRDENFACGEFRSNAPEQKGIGIGIPVDILKFHTENDIKNNFNSYKFESLNPSKLDQSSELCSPDNKICCSFSAKHQESLEGKDFTYMFVAYSKLDRGCALMSCSSTDPHTCGNRLRTNKFVFDEVKISSSINETYVIPSSLTYNMKPIDNYKFCRTPSKYEIKGNRLSSLTTFGIYSINSANTIADKVIILIIACAFSISIFK